MLLPKCLHFRQPRVLLRGSREGQGEQSLSVLSETDVLVNYNWLESTQMSSPKGLHLKMVVDISPISGSQRQDCGELLNHAACSSSAVLLAAAITVGVLNCACCSLGGTGLTSLFLPIQGMLDISLGCLEAVLIQLSWKNYMWGFLYSLSLVTGSGVSQSTTKGGSTCIKSIRDWPQSWKSLRSPLAQRYPFSCARYFIWVFDMEYLFF